MWLMFFFLCCLRHWCRCSLLPAVQKAKRTAKAKAKAREHKQQD